MNVTDSQVKRARYNALVEARKACRACAGLTNPSVCHGGTFDRDEVGAWSRWQGNLDANLMVIGQDWGDVAWFVREAGCSTSTSQTNRTLVKLLGDAGFEVKLPCESSGRGALFFTNAVLCLKEGGAQARVRDECFRNCGTRFLRPLIDLIRPRVVACLGERAYRAVLTSCGLRPGKFREAVESESPVDLPGGVSVFAVYHCGARILNTHRRFSAQRDDWRRIGKFLARQEDSGLPCNRRDNDL
jgi:DNA polymerase